MLLAAHLEQVGDRMIYEYDFGDGWEHEVMLAALADPAHPERGELLEWLGGEFDAEAFDPAEVEFDDPRSRWESAFGDADN